MGRITDYYKYIKEFNKTPEKYIGYERIADEQDIVLLVDILSIEFVPEHLRCFKSFNGVSVIGYMLGEIKELGYDVTYEEAKRICEAAKKRAKLKKKLLIKESLEV